MTKTPKIFFCDNWFDEFLLNVRSCIDNIHGCIISTSIFGSDSFPCVVVHRKEITSSFVDTVRMNIAFVIRTDYRGQKQEIDIMNAIKKYAQKPIALKNAGAILRYQGEEQKISEKKVRQASLFFQMTLRFKEGCFQDKEDGDSIE